MRYVFASLLFFLLIRDSTNAQNQRPDLKEVADLFALKGKNLDETMDQMMAYLIRQDTATVTKELNELRALINSNSNFARARFNVLEARIIFTKFGFLDTLYDKPSNELSKVKGTVLRLFNEAIDLAYRSENDYLLAFVSYHYAMTINFFGEKGLAVMYARNAIEIYERLNYPIEPTTYQNFAELMYQVREYRLSLEYARKGVEGYKLRPQQASFFLASTWNTVALGYHRLKMYDSALYEYNSVLEFTKEKHDTVWEGIISGNIAQILYVQEKYDSAYQLLMKDYRISKNATYYNNAANSLQWAARCDLALGRREAALEKVRESIELLRLWPDPGYKRNTLFTYAAVFRALGKFDSSFYYMDQHSQINDSLEKIVNTSSLSISKARLDNEVNKYNIQNLNKEKRSQIQLRNILIVGIVVMSVIGLLIVNRSRLRQKMKMEKAEQEKKLMEQQIVSAREQMQMFTTNIIEKTSLIEKLEEQIAGRQATAEQQSIIAELSQQSILTEEDWVNFKSLYERIYPGFFMNLKEKAQDITVAEQRMAALIRLQLTTKQIASMLGISVDSVHKTRQRLRQRLQLSGDVSLEDSIAMV